jgi:hypothetical protein
VPTPTQPIPRHLRPDAVRKNAQRIAAYIEQLADQMSITTQFPAMKAEIESSRTTIKTLESDKAAQASQIQTLTAELAQYKALDAQADALMAGSTGVSPVTPAPAAAPAPAASSVNPIDRLPG